MKKRPTDKHIRRNIYFSSRTEAMLVRIMTAWRRQRSDTMRVLIEDRAAAMGIKVK